MEQQLSRLGRAASKHAEAKADPDTETKVRFTAKGFITLRQRLELSAAEMGRLLEVTGQSIYSWEAGNSSPRKPQLVRIAMLRKMGKREVSTILEQLAK